MAACLTVAEQLLPRWLVSMHADAKRRGTATPEVILTAMNSDKVIATVRDGSADAGFIEGPTVPKGLRSTIIARDELVVIVPPNHRWARRSAPISAKELSETPMVAREPGSGTRESYVAALQHSLGDLVELAPPVLELSSATAIRAAVLAGAGPAAMSRLSAASDLALNRLREIQVAGVDFKRDLRAICFGARADQSHSSPADGRVIVSTIPLA